MLIFNKQNVISLKFLKNKLRIIFTTAPKEKLKASRVISTGKLNILAMYIEHIYKIVFILNIFHYIT